jgi:hypothetical protein
MAFTGLEIAGLVGAAVVLLTLGGVAVVASRRGRRPEVA